MLTLCKLRNKIEALEKRLLEGAENDEHSSMSARGMQTPVRSAVRLLFFAHIWESNEGSRQFIVGALQWFWGKRMEAIGNMHRSARISISFGPPLPGNSFWPGNRWSQDWTASKPTQRRFFRHETVLIGKGAIRYTNITKTNTTHTQSIPILGSKITLESSCVVRKHNQGGINTENLVSPYWRSFLEKCAIFPFDAQGSRERSDESFQSKATGSVKGPRHWITDRILPAFWFQTKNAVADRLVWKSLPTFQGPWGSTKPKRGTLHRVQVSVEDLL